MTGFGQIKPWQLDETSMIKTAHAKRLEIQNLYIISSQKTLVTSENRALFSDDSEKPISNSALVS